MASLGHWNGMRRNTFQLASRLSYRKRQSALAISAGRAPKFSMACKLGDAHWTNQAKPKPSWFLLTKPTCSSWSSCLWRIINVLNRLQKIWSRWQIQRVGVESVQRSKHLGLRSICNKKLLGAPGLTGSKDAISNKCIASSNRCIAPLSKETTRGSWPRY